MISRNSVTGIAATAVVLLMTAACGSDNGAETTPTTEHRHDTRSSIAATTSPVLNAAQEAIQNAINAALAAAPINFDSGSSDLSAVDVATIKAVAVPLKGNDAKIEITTYAQDANSATAKALAESRGDNIAAELESEGIDKARISVHAEANPTAQDVEIDEARIEVVAD
ncbi:OmpA family protein [Nocardia sp. NBC_00508]|uniref:OmpA family protein n=1 Tax=Nocardia sp. NBC_00508 TaxID=2975992 RepID=UPI002E7FEA7A|nr:OmpA family protein [Nocardia sp. NBC_00508]WUD67257.1 OmpA family protein [Nocardia sp. NBC_00508]